MNHKNCLRCGTHIRDETNKLWCKRCLKKVNEELEGEADRERSYYFRYHIKQIKHDRNSMQTLLKTNTAKRN